jgi:hypothetical protein
MSKASTPRERFRVLTRRRGSYDAEMFDVQLQVIATGALVWAQSFSDAEQADDFRDQVQADLESLDLDTFRVKYSVPSTS